jgi:hypothetical protein
MSVKDIKEAVAAQQLKQKEIQEDYTFCGQQVTIKRITAHYFEEAREWSDSQDINTRRAAKAKMVQLCFYEPDTGVRIYDDNEVNQLVGFDAIDIDDAYHACLRVNGFSPAGKEGILKNLLKILGEDGLRELREIIDARLQSSSKDIPTTS